MVRRYTLSCSAFSKPSRLVVGVLWVCHLLSASARHPKPSTAYLPSFSLLAPPLPSVFSY